MNITKIIIRRIILLPGLLWFLAVIGCSKQSFVAPLLVLAIDHEFGTYTAEILKAEGFNEFNADSLTDPKITLQYLNQFDLVILGETAVSKPEMDMFTDYVKSGGNLIEIGRAHV